MSNKIFTKLTVIFSLLILFTINLNAQKIYDLIQTQNFVAGKTDSVLISDMFYADKYDELVLTKNSSINLKFNFDETKLIFTPQNNFEGIGLIGFNFFGRKYEITVRVNKAQYIEFTFSPGKKYTKVFLFGSFNSWNRSDLEMKNKDSAYQVTIPLEPGRYQYKFFADSVELIDPANPEKIPNGMGDYNSVLTVEPKHKTQPFLHVLGSEVSKNESKFSFEYENPESYENISKDNLIALLNNNQVPIKETNISNNKIDILLLQSEIKGKNTLRLAVTQNSQSTNLQTIILFDGKPAGSNKNYFTWHDAIIYSALIDRFDDGDKSINKPIKQDSLFDKANYMGGDLQGIIIKSKKDNLI